MSQPDPNPEIVGDRRKAAPSLRRYRRARSLAALLRPATPPLGTRPAEKLKALERENRELRQANEILRKASAYFAQAELDRRFKP